MRMNVSVAAIAAIMLVGVDQVQAENCAAVFQECLSVAAEYRGSGGTCRRAFRNSQGGFFQTGQRPYVNMRFQISRPCTPAGHPLRAFPAQAPGRVAHWK